MKISFKNFIKYIFILIFVVAGLLYANGVFYHLWLISGPTTTALDAHKKMACWYSITSVLFFIFATAISKIKFNEK